MKLLPQFPINVGSAAAILASVLALAFSLLMLTTPASAQSSNFGSESPFSSVAPATTISADITANTTWDLNGSPYVITSSVHIKPGITLTIDPGVEVRLDQYVSLIADAPLNTGGTLKPVGGTLNAVGTATQPITFTGDFPAGATPAPGFWNCIQILGADSTHLNTGSVLSYVNIRYGGDGYKLPAHANLYLTYAHVAISHANIDDADGDGIYADLGGTPDVSDTSFSSNIQHANSNNGYAVELGDGSVDPVLANLSASGNTYDGIALDGGTLAGSNTWDASGLPYYLTRNETLAAGGTLTIAPGVEVRLDQYVSLIAEGTLNAVGTATQPITFTGDFPAGATPTPGSWTSIQILGTASQPNVGSTIQYATVEYGGNGTSEIQVGYGKVNITDSQILSSGSDGFYAGPGGAGSSIHNSQIVNNSNYAVENTDPAGTLMADNNWWGSANGPVVTNGCNPAGSGGRINGKVAFEPFLTSGSLQSNDLAGGDAILVSMSPLRWFVPADGVSRAWVRLTVRDGNGLPLSGRVVNLISSLGNVTDGEITDVQGQTWAFITSSTPGDAQLSPSLSHLGICESARGASATITFTSPSSAGQVLPDSAAPYLDESIQVDPLPVVQGVATTLSARFTNPDSSPITLTATFGIAQEGIGLTFGPIGEQQITIPANGQGIAQVTWTPLISGHYCVQVLYSAQAASSLPAAASAPLGFFSSGSSQRNLDIAPAHLNTYPQKGAALKGQAGINAISNAQTAADLAVSPEDATGFFIPNWLFSHIIDWNNSAWGKASGAIGKDPPRQDYTVLATLKQFTFTPVQAGNGISAARAQAANDLMTAELDLTSKLDAAEVSQDRYSGATEANDLQWASLQASAYLYYRSLSASAMITTADKLDAMITEMQSEGIPDRVLTADMIKAYQNRLITVGFNTDELTAAQAIGLTPDEIEEIRQTRINEDPNLAAGSVTALVEAESSALRQMGQAFQATSPVTSALAYQAGLSSATTPNQLFLTSTQTYSIQVGNPQTQSATIDLKVRPIDLPDDWGVSITPSTITLGPGQQITATLVVAPSPTSVQGSHPRVAVEGYIQNQLIGGVVQDILVPIIQPFDGKLRLFLPIITQ